MLSLLYRIVNDVCEEDTILSVCEYAYYGVNWYGYYEFAIISLVAKASYISVVAVPVFLIAVLCSVVHW